MKTILAFLAVACQATFALAQDDKTPYMTKSLANDAINSVYVSTSAGGIKVSGTSGEAPRVEVYIRGNNNHDLSKEEIEKKLKEDYEMTIDVSNHELKAVVKTRHEFHDWNHGMSISFKIYVPQNVSTELTTSGGGIQLDHLHGKENFRTSGGGLDVADLTGEIHGTTSGGGIRVSDSGDQIDLTTSGGGIEAKECHGDIRLKTSGGGIVLRNLKGNIYAHTSGGGVDADNIEGELNTGSSGGGLRLHDMSCSLDATTSAGSVDADIKQVGKYVRLSTSAGNINLTLPAKQGLDLDLSGERVEQTEFHDFHGQFDKDHVKGSINGGGVSVDAHASSGHISVRFN
jgi:DUF4097 and DUF4098 domain-containing protein YvlB